MNKKIWIGIIVLLLMMPCSVFAEEVEVKLSKCVDGDTARFMIGKKEYSTRFLAIDTPETKHPKRGVEPYGKEASDYTCRMLKKAKKIVLEYDPNSTKEDKYGRKLAWIFVDGELLQKQLVKRGYAKVAYLYGDYKYTNTLKIIEKKAKVEKIGIWSNKQVRKDSSSISINKILNKIYRYIRKEIKSML